MTDQNSTIQQVEPTVEPVVEEPITFQKIKDMSGKELREKRRDPKLAAEIDQAIADHNQQTNQPAEPAVDAPEDEAEKARRDAEAAKAEADRVAAETARIEQEKRDFDEKVRVAAEERAKEIEASKPKKIVVEYQVRDTRTGEPIGDPTHLEADTWEEMSKKQTEVHANAVRWADRQRRKRELLEKAAKAEPEPVAKVMTQEEIETVVKDLEDKDPVKKVAALRKVTGADEVEEEKRKAKIAKAAADAERQSLIFLQRHTSGDYLNCEANTKQLAEYIKVNNLAWTADNLDLAVEELGDKLAQPVRQVEPTPQPTPQPRPAPVAAAPVAAPVDPVVEPVPDPEPVAAAPVVEELAPVIPPTPAPARRAPAGGIEPGSLRGARPSATVGLTKQDVAKMSGEEFKRRLKDPNFKKQLNALGIKA